MHGSSFTFHKALPDLDPWNQQQLALPFLSPALSIYCGYLVMAYLQLAILALGALHPCLADSERTVRPMMVKTSLMDSIAPFRVATYTAPLRLKPMSYL